MNLILIIITFLTLFNACESEVDKIPDIKSLIIKRHRLDDKISETSGLIKYNGLVWTFNDSGGKPAIYGYNLAADSIEQVITIKNAVNKDWEDIAQDEHYIYVGDFGNNQGTRDSLIVYKVAKSTILHKGNAFVISEKIVFQYPDYTPVAIPSSFSSFDCEAMVATKDNLYIFTKDWSHGTTTIYSIPKNPGKYLAKKINQLNPNGLVTGADINNDNLILIGYSNFTPFIIKYSFLNLSTLKDEQGIRYDLNDLSTYQTEGICFDGDKILISSEKTRAPAQIIELDLK